MMKMSPLEKAAYDAAADKVQHLVYSRGKPAGLDPGAPTDGMLRVSYCKRYGVFATKYACDQFIDTGLTLHTLDLLRNVVPWLWRPGMPMEYQAVAEMSGLICQPPPLRKLVVKLTPTPESELALDEDGVEVSEVVVVGEDVPLVQAHAQIYKLNRADEWVRTFESPGEANDYVQLPDWHELWRLLIASMSEANDQARESQSPRRAAPSFWQDLRRRPG